MIPSSSKTTAFTKPAEAAILGVACRLPGAADVHAFWRLLTEGRCAVGPLPAGRWDAARYFHPRMAEPGFSYSFDGGYVEAPLDFDPAVFGISPREAAEMDPQQRLLLEVVWSALEDCGIPPSGVAGQNVGVYVGASSLDYGNLHTTDPASIESHFMTGNTLSILSNRISYIFDLRGPSFTIDTACSSSLVAFAEAQAAITSGRIDMAVVAGVNLLLSPTSFIGFSRASMLSPTGLCRPFSAAGDGYVRAEGAVAMVLCRLETALARQYPVRAVAVASGINSDGRTNGIALPSADGQRALLDRLYGEGGIDPRGLAFVEAHGTGTRVGDPAEAGAIGGALAHGRNTPLPIGSVKSNIGHLEPASGLAGVLKAMLALEHRLLPATLHADQLNPAIDFDALNLVVAREAVTLPATGTWLAGISSFGFGGTNAHAVIRQAEPAERPVARQNGAAGHPAEMLVLSAHSKQALADTAAAYADAFEAGADVARIASGVAWQRDLAGHRLALPLSGRDDAAATAALRRFAETGRAAAGLSGVSPSGAPKICFVYSGNGCQWAGMGRAAFAGSAAFRRRFEEVDVLFGRLADWSLTAALHDDELADRLKQTRIAQPLLFAVQSALTAALADWGLRPGMVLGHSVGEVAAAEASGALDLSEAVRVIYHRSEHQEAARGLGGMMVVSMSAQECQALLDEPGVDGLEIAAVNSPGSVTLSGSDEALAVFSRIARKRRTAVVRLGLAYPFHSALLEILRRPLLSSLGEVAARAGEVPFLSTVTAGVLSGEALDREYWWRNVREPVRFQSAVEASARLGATLFIEIGPRPILTGNISDTIGAAAFDGSVLPSLTDRPLEEHGASDPLAAIAASALVQGCVLDQKRLSGARPTGRVALPPYAWQRKTFSQPQTSEALDIYGRAARHPLIGSRLAQGVPEWRTLIDATVVPYLADHRIDGEIVVPGTAFAEMALAVAREIFPAGAIGLEDFDLLHWMTLRADAMREVSVRLSGDTHIVEIWSRPRLGADEWTLHARGRITALASSPPVFVDKETLPHRMTAERVYACATAAGVDYGPAFRRLAYAERSDTVIEVSLLPLDVTPNAEILHPIALDAAFHAMFENIKLRPDERYAYLPVRFANLRVDKDGGIPARARVVVDRETDQSVSVSISLYDKHGGFIAGVTGGLLRAVVLDRPSQERVFYTQKQVRLSRSHREGEMHAAAMAALRSGAVGLPESWLLLGAFARSLAFQSLRSIFGDAAIGPASLRDGRLAAAASAPLIMALLEHLAAAGLALESNEGWVLAQESGLPKAADILLTLVASDAGATSEIVLAAQALTGLEDALRSGEPIQTRPAAWEMFESYSLLFAPALAACRDICEALYACTAPEPLRLMVAHPFCLGLLRTLSPMVREGRVLMTVMGTDARRLHQTQARHGQTEGVVFHAIDAETDDSSTPGVVPHVQFDAAFAFAFGSAFDGDVALARAVAARLPPHGSLYTLQPPDTLLLDVLLGTDVSWFQATVDPRFPLGRMAAAQDASGLLAAAGFARLQSHTLGKGMGSVLMASRNAVNAVPLQNAAPVVLLSAPSSARDRLAEVLESAGRPIQLLDFGRHPPAMRAALEAGWAFVTSNQIAGEMADLVFQAVQVPSDLGTILAHLAAVLDVIQHARCRLWVVVRGLQPCQTVDGVDPLAEAVWCFTRVAMNEYPDLDIRLVDLSTEMDAASAAHALAHLIVSPAADTELLIDATGMSAVRMVPWLPDAGSDKPVPAARLALCGRGLQASFDWREASRRAPGPGEVEIEIAASGLNFRDIMLGTGLLDDDVLDDGLAGAVFGFECAGRVVRIGSAVTHFAVGDAVMGFGRESFATHSTADARVFTRVPATVSLEAAATIPVAFLTAWYALVHLARIEPGEWVLIHGAAGGVGLAAIQIAQLRRARVVATVSSPDKEAVARLFGAERIYNSRDTSFLEAIRVDIGGVDVVLNSLAGDAMQAGVKCLKPFGRFVELGKRDYVTNTALGLRPFRRNLTYYGVDLDQLLAAKLSLANELMTDLARHFDDETLLPLPYRAFEWFEAHRAFQSMQAATHVGKLLVRPPVRPLATVSSDVLFRAADGVHLVVGGTGGFGFETASWLASCGAKTIVVASRRGRIEPHLEARAAAIRAAGATLYVETLDVTDGDAVTALVERLSDTHGRLAGIVHAAMVLDDGLIATLDPVRTRAVLSPKVDGAANLDRATGGLSLDYFVVFSSATTMVGNPGQAAYVAANGYLQGLMRRRRSAGLPGLAVGWGAIADAGVLTRDRKVAERLDRMSGIAGMPAKDALSHLGRLLTRGDDCPPTVYCAIIRPGAALQALKLLGSPTFSMVFEAADGGSQDQGVDLAAQIAGKSDGDARMLVARLVALEVGRIFRLPQEEIDLARPLDELGLDSMMSLDLRLGIEKRFGVDMPVVGISAGVSVNDLATRLLTALRAEAAGTAADDAGMAMIQQHGSADIGAAELAAFTEAVRERDSAGALL